MAKITVEFTTDNVSFEDNPYEEMAYVYRQCIDAYRGGRTSPSSIVALFDSNGNIIGHVISGAERSGAERSII
jgi:hypothetical protein